MKNFINTIKKINRDRKIKNKEKKLKFILKEPVKKLSNILNEYKKNSIPVIVVSYNNEVYVKNLVMQLNAFNIKPIVIDNNSPDPITMKCLLKLEENGSIHLIRIPYNFGHMVGFVRPIYEILPEIFAYTDPDIQFNSMMPKDFLEILSNLAERYMAFKAGLAMDIKSGNLSNATVTLSSNEPIYINKRYNISDGEAPFWTRRICHETLEVYAAKIDTIFAVYRKSNYRGDFFDAIRVAGQFNALHLPWYPDKDPMSISEKRKYLIGNISTTWFK